MDILNIKPSKISEKLLKEFLSQKPRYTEKPSLETCTPTAWLRKYDVT